MPQARYYIEALRKDGTVILGNLDGQAALGSPKFPQRCAMWRQLIDPKKFQRPNYVRVHSWRIVDHSGAVFATYINPKYVPLGGKE